MLLKLRTVHASYYRLAMKKPNRSRKQFHYSCHSPTKGRFALGLTSVLRGA